MHTRISQELMSSTYRGYRRSRVILAAVAVLFVVSSVLVVGLPLRLATSALRDQSADRVDDTAGTSAVSIQRQLDDLKAAVDAYSTDADLVGSSMLPLGEADNPVRRTLAGIQNANRDTLATATVDVTGRISAVQPWNPGVIGQDVSDRDYFKTAMARDEPYLSDSFVARASDQPRVVVVSKRVEDRNGDAVGVLFMTVEIETTFQRWVDEFELSSHTDIAIYDGTGAVVSAGSDAIPSPMTDQANQSDESVSNGSSQERVDGVDLVIGRAMIGGTDWSVSSFVPSNEAFASVDRLRTRTLVTAAILGIAVLIGLLLIVRVVRDRARARDDLSQTELRMQRVIETTDQMFIEFDKHGLITEWNKCAERVTGWTRSEVVGNSILDYTVLPEDHAQVLATMKLIETSPEAMATPFRDEKMIQRKAPAEPILVELSIWSTSVDGEDRLNVLLQDITERRSFDNQRELVVKQQNQLVDELREAAQTKSDFISTISHELRTPLTSIVGYLEMLREGYGGNLSNQQESMLDVVDRNSRRLLNLIDDLLTLSRIEAGTFRVEPIDVEIASLIVNAVQTFIPSASEKELDLEIDVAADIGTVRGDPGQLERIILNLVSNAVKFTPNGGRVAVRAYNHAEGVHVSIQDTGIGIPIEEQARLFTRFFRASDAQARAIQGTGLGLTIVKSIVERHDGEVLLQSAPGGGTTVEVVLPRTES